MKAEEKIFKAYLDLKESRLYYNQLKEYTKLSHSSLQNVLKTFLKTDILRSEKTKSNTYYKIRDKKIFALKFSELAVNRFNDLNLHIRIPLKNFLKEIPISVFTVVIFGSAARKEEKEGSDIDLLVVSDRMQGLERVEKKVNALSNHPLSLFYCDIKTFVKNKDPIVIQARKKGFPIYKEQNFYEVMLDEY